MNEDLRQALILAVVGFIIMIFGSLGVMRVTSVEIACTLVVVCGALLVILALILASYPKAMNIFRREDNRTQDTAIPSDEEPKQ